jgi:hypothetical protein
MGEICYVSCLIHESDHGRTFCYIYVDLNHLHLQTVLLLCEQCWKCILHLGLSRVSNSPLSFSKLYCISKSICSRHSDWPRAERRRGRSWRPGRVKNFHFSTSSRRALWSTQSPIQRIPGALSLRVKRQEGGVDHSPPASAEFKKMWMYTSTPPYAFMA